jgi:hypothetical protein
VSYIQIASVAIGVVLATAIVGYSGYAYAGAQEGKGEHGRESGEHGKEKGEESGTELALNETYDEVRHGARLILAYDSDSNSFKGTVENTTEKRLKRVRIEVHLSNGIELGPTTPVDLDPGKKGDVILKATEIRFDKWSAHAEVGSGEHGHGRGEGHGEHGREGKGEHKKEHN